MRHGFHVTPRLDGFQQDFIHQANDGRFLRHLGKFRTIGFDIAEKLDPFLLFTRGGDEAIDRFAADAEVPLDELGDVGPARENGQHRQAGGRADFVQRVEIEGVAGGDDKLTVVPRDGKQRLPVNQLLRKDFEERKIDGSFRQVDVFQADRGADRFERLFFGNEAQIYGRFDEAEPVAMAVGLAAGALELLAAEQSALN